MKKLTGGMIIILLLTLVYVLNPGTAFTQDEVTCEQDVIVQADDTLSILANQFYGDVLAFPAIVQATNAKAASDDSYARIDDANVLESGWKLCIPSAEDAQAILDELGPTAVAQSGARVGFPEGYQENFQILYEFDRPNNKSARVIWGNDLAASVTSDQFTPAASVSPGQPFPYGSVIVMEVYRTERDDQDNVVLDANGRYVRSELNGIFVMRKEPGYGTLYGAQRNGEWEYAAYRPDGTESVPTGNSQPCATCHVEAGQGKDWVFGTHRIFDDAIPEVGENQVNVIDYTFQQNDLTVQVGTEVQWINNDPFLHTVTADDISFNSGALRQNSSFGQTFEEPGVFTYFCAIHPTMTGTITVVE